MADTKLKSVDGNSIAIEDAAGKKGTLVVFTCNSCPFAKAWENRIAAIGNAAMRRGIGVIAINANDPDRNADGAGRARLDRFGGIEDEVHYKLLDLGGVGQDGRGRGGFDLEGDGLGNRGAEKRAHFAHELREIDRLHT